MHELKDFSYSFLELKKFNKKPKGLKTMIEKMLLSDSEAKGKAEGMIVGKIEVAKTMKNAGMKKDVIQQLTGLSKEELEEIFVS